MLLKGAYCVEEHFVDPQCSMCLLVEYAMLCYEHDLA